MYIWCNFTHHVHVRAPYVKMCVCVCVSNRSLNCVYEQQAFTYGSNFLPSSALQLCGVPSFSCKLKRKGKKLFLETFQASLACFTCFTYYKLPPSCRRTHTNAHSRSHSLSQLMEYMYYPYNM
jgi:hypothetical protein